jgi:hypothetical protein
MPTAAVLSWDCSAGRSLGVVVRRLEGDMQAWEYDVLTLNANHGKWVWAHHLNEQRTWVEVLNEWGEGGWELVSVVPCAHASGDNLAGVTTTLQYFFKRPVQRGE